MIPAPVPPSILPRTLQVSRIQVQDNPDLVRPCGLHPAHSGVGYHDFAVEANRRQACSAASWGRLSPDLAPHDPVVRSIPKIADSHSFLVVCKEQTETLSAAPSSCCCLIPQPCLDWGRCMGTAYTIKGLELLDPSARYIFVWCASQSPLLPFSFLEPATMCKRLPSMPLLFAVVDAPIQGTGKRANVQS